MTMKILKLTLETTMLEEMKAFYSTILQLPIVHQTETSFTVQVGKSRLVYIHSERKPYYHVAYRTSDTYFDQMYTLLEKQQLLLPDEEGKTLLFWKGKQLYFRDSEGNVMEILSRPNPYDEDLGGFFDICEVGLPSNNVDEMSQFLSEINNEFASNSNTFRFYGDELGVFVLVKEGRPWYPLKRKAQIDPIKIEVEVTSINAKIMKYPSLPYEIKLKAPWDSKVLPVYQVRIARPTNQMEKVMEFYEKGVCLKRIGEFQHNGYHGVMYGLPDSSYHLEFTTHKDALPCPAPTDDNLLVFYLTDLLALENAKKRLQWIGYREVEPVNPYWKKQGATFADPDGWRIVFCYSPGI